MRSPLDEYISSARWFGGKGRGFRVGDVRRLGWLGLTEPVGEGSPAGRVRIELVTLDYDDGGSETYQLPLVYYPSPQERLERSFVAEVDDPEAGQSFVYDALADRHAAKLWLAAFAEGRTTADLAFHRLEGHDLDLTTYSALMSGEQSNSSLRYGEESLMKVFRKVTPGPNPDIEIHSALTAAGNANVAALYGWLETRGDDDSVMHLAMLSQYLRTASDGWELALASVRDLFAEADLYADEVGGDFAGEAERLGQATAVVHEALAEHFSTSALGSEQLVDLSASMVRRLDEAVAAVYDLEEHADSLRLIFEAVARIEEPGTVQRIHGDLHLGQTLRTAKGWKLVDFEGEPAKPLSERVRPDSAWRDVAGMLRSFDYAAHAVETDVEADAGEGAQIAYRAAEWVERNSAAFLEGYIAASHLVRPASDDSGGDGDHEAGDLPGNPPGEGARGADALSDDQRLLLRAYLADKAVYEVVYEARNRPDWIAIPLAAIARLTRAHPADPEKIS